MLASYQKSLGAIFVLISLLAFGRVSVPNFHGFSALFIFSSVSARFFNPQLGGAGALPPGSGGTDSTPFRIDHDERFNQTTHMQYQPWKAGPWMGFNCAMTAGW
jgi:hypothetical protein